MARSRGDRTAPAIEPEPEPEYGPAGKVLIKHQPYRSDMIILMNHPASFVIDSNVILEVLNNSVTVLGNKLTRNSQSLTLFSTEETGLHLIETWMRAKDKEKAGEEGETSEEVVVEVKSDIPKEDDKSVEEESNMEELEECIFKFTESREKTNAILSKVKLNTAVIHVRPCPLGPKFSFVDQCYPQMFKYTQRNKYFVNKSCLEQEPIEFALCEKELAQKIRSYLKERKKKSPGKPPLIILFCGPRNSGKSTVIRFLINALLADCPSAYLDPDPGLPKFKPPAYLETDPGLPEFTPPGVISLTKVTKPMIGPPFMDLRKPEKMIFTGTNEYANIDGYYMGLAELMKCYENIKDEIGVLFVNTKGCLKGQELEILENILGIVKPSTVYRMFPEKYKSSMFDATKYVAAHQGVVNDWVETSYKKRRFSRCIKQKLSLLSYFGECQMPFEPSVPFYRLPAYCVAWDRIAVYLVYNKVQPFRMCQAINNCVVALCHVPETNIIESHIPGFHRTLLDPENEFLGYGFVRAADENAHKLYIITPLKFDQLKNVNALMKTDIKLPSRLLLNQKEISGILPYTDASGTDFLSDDDASCSEESSTSVAECQLQLASLERSNPSTDESESSSSDSESSFSEEECEFVVKQETSTSREMSYKVGGSGYKVSYKVTRTASREMSYTGSPATHTRSRVKLVQKNTKTGKYEVRRRPRGRFPKRRVPKRRVPKRRVPKRRVPKRRKK